MIYRCLYKAKALVEMFCLYFEGLLVVVTFPPFLALSYSSQVFGPLRLFFYSHSHSFILFLSFFSVLTTDCTLSGSEDELCCVEEERHRRGSGEEEPPGKEMDFSERRRRKTPLWRRLAFWWNEKAAAKKNLWKLNRAV